MDNNTPIINNIEDMAVLEYYLSEFLGYAEKSQKHGQLGYIPTPPSLHNELIAGYIEKIVMLATKEIERQ